MPSRFVERVRRILRSLIEPSDSLRDPVAVRRAQLAAAFSGLGILGSLLGVLMATLSGAPVWLPTSLSLLTLALIFAYIFSRSIAYRAGINWMIGSLLIWGLIYPLFDIRLAPVSLLLLVGSALVLAGALLTLRTVVLLIAGVVFYVLLLPPSPVLEQRTVLALGGGMAFMSAVSATISLLQRRVEEQQTGELVDLRENFEKRVEEHTAEIREAVGVGQVIAAAGSLEEITRLVSRLIPSRLGFLASRLFLVDESGRYLVEQVAREEGGGSEKGLRVAVGSSSILGWAAQNKLLRVASQTGEDPLQIEKALVEGAQSQVVIPLLVRDTLVGVLDIQGEQVGTFDDWSVVAVLQILANQIAVAVQNARRFQTAQFGVEDVSELYRRSYQVTQAQSEAEVVAAVKQVFSHSPYLSLYLLADGDGLRLETGFDPLSREEGAFPGRVSIPIRDLEDYLASGPFIADGPRLQALPYELVRLLRRFDIFSAAMVPVRLGEETAGVMLVGTRETRPLSESSVQPYLTLSDLVAETLTRLEEERQIRRRMVEVEVLARAMQEFALLADSELLYRKVHEYVREALGQVNFQLVLYHEESGTLSIPYLFDKDREGGEIGSVEAFPLGEGLTSVVVRTKQPLLLADRVNERAGALGVRLVNEKPVEAWELVMLGHVSPAFVAQMASRAPKSWLGVPLVAGEAVLGAVVVQDVERERAFNESDLKFLQTLATQAGNALHNLRLIEETRRRAIQLQTAAEIAREISLSLDVNEVLSKAVNLIRDRFDFYHAAVFLLDAANEYAVIREATGEAGQQMKRSGHRLKIGSTSIVGYVTGSGEPLIVNDTSRDATYYPNPLLPDTRAEAALPLKVGTRILGALDVQSTRPYSFTEDAMGVLRILADQLAVAVLNSELFAETQEHLSQHRLLHHVTTAAASGTTMEEALVGAAQGLQVTLGGDRVTILLADTEKRVLRVRAYAGYSEEISHLEIPFGQGITGWVAEHQQLLRVNDVAQDPRYMQISSDVRSELAIPLLYRGELLGVLNVESEQLGAYDESDEEMLGTLAGSLAAIIANARLLDQVRRQVERERLVYELTTRIRRATSMQGVMATTVAELSKVLGARRARIKVGVGEEEGASGENGGGENVPGGQQL